MGPLYIFIKYKKQFYVICLKLPNISINYKYKNSTNSANSANSENSENSENSKNSKNNSNK